MVSPMKTLFRSEQGYALILTLIFMPIFVGVALMTIDLGRAYNAQQDHQAAADALALAGAAELDKGVGSIARAKAAMTKITNTVSFLDATVGSTQVLSYVLDSSAPFYVAFLTNIPENDDTPIDATYIANNTATTDITANFVLVFSRSNDMQTLFFDPISRTQSTLPIGAIAVAKLSRTTCDLAPLFMCNPFTANGSTSAKDVLVQKFVSGELHGRMVKLTDSPASSAPGPGNIGFLQTSGNGARELAEALAGKRYEQCVTSTPTVTTQPGAVTSALDGFNTRFDIYSPTFGGLVSSSGAYVPALNVRKGWYAPATGNGGGGGGGGNGGGNGGGGGGNGGGNGGGGNGGGNAGGGGNGNATPAACVQNPVSAADYVFTQAPVFSDNQDVDLTLPVAFRNILRTGNWNFSRSITVNGVTSPPYWQTLYPSTTYPSIGFPSVGSTEYNALIAQFDTRPLPRTPREPSRYEVYRYEIERTTAGIATSTPSSNSIAATVRSAGGERGAPECRPNPTSAVDRRTMLVAVVDCGTYNNIKASNGGNISGRTDVPVDLLAQVFLVNPLKGSSNNPGSNSFDFEFVDLSEGSNGIIDKYFRDEVVLVR